MNPINGFVVICLIITCGYFVGLINFLTDYEREKCEVTYMFEYPQFVRISNKYDKNYPKYELYAYSEGRLTERARHMYFDGVPVLFIPGNAGSHKQVRSLSSVALRKSLNSHTPFHLDYFTINLNQEYSGLNGALLFDQLEYINSSIYRILELYKERKNPPKSIVLVGHSMGGVIARSLLTLQPPDSNLFPIVITLAAPLKRPPLLLDVHLHNFYKTISTNSSLHPRTTFVSISGSFSDLLIAPALSDLRDNNSIHVASTNIPLSWLQANHVQILWCKQMVKVVTRALFDSVDQKTGQISNDSKFRQWVFRHHLIHHSGSRVQQAEKMRFSHKGEWIENIQNQYSIKLTTGLRKPHWYMIKLTNLPHYEMLTLVAINLEVVDWVFICDANYPDGVTRVCLDGHHLTHLSEISPSVLHKRRTLRVNLHELKRNYSHATHLVFRALPTSEPITFHVDNFASSHRTVTVDLPGWYSMKRQVIINQTAKNAVHYDLLLPQLQHVIQSYRLFLEAYDCTTDDHHATASLIVPWGNEDYHGFFTNSQQGPMEVKLYNSKPPWGSSDSPLVRLTLEPTCKYRVSIQSSFAGMLGQLARNYTNLLFANIAVVVLMIFRTQLRHISEKRTCSVFFTAIAEGAKPYYVLPFVKIVSRIISVPAVAKFFPTPDWVLITEDGTDFFLLPILLYTCSVGIVWILAMSYCVSLVMLESTVNKLALKFLAKTVSFNVSWSDYVLSALHKLPFVVVGVLISLSLSTCGGLALCVGLVFYFLKLSQMSQDFIEEVVWMVVKKFAGKCKSKIMKKPNKIEDKTNGAVSEEDKQKEEQEQNNKEKTVVVEPAVEAYNAIFFHSTIFFIWFLVAALNIPAVLTWAHNFKHSKILQSDPSLIPGLILSICAIPLWHLELPRVDRKWYKALSYTVMVIAILALVFSAISLYRLNYILTGVVVLIILHQLCAPVEIQVKKEEKHEKYEDVKAKWE